VTVSTNAIQHIHQRPRFQHHQEQGNSGGS
jgi:hypothetical protein